MSKFSYCILGLAALLSGNVRASEPVTVTSTDGIAFNASPEEVKKAYLSVVSRKSTNAEKMAVNEDGSITIVRPYFQYNDENLRIDWNYSVAIGTCKRFGFDKFVGKQNEEIRGDVYVAVLGENGQLRDLTAPRDYPDREKHTVLKSVACRD